MCYCHIRTSKLSLSFSLLGYGFIILFWGGRGGPFDLCAAWDGGVLGIWRHGDLLMMLCSVVFGVKSVCIKVWFFKKQMYWKLPSPTIPYCHGFKKCLEWVHFCASVKFCIAVLDTELQDVTPIKNMHVSDENTPQSHGSPLAAFGRICLPVTVPRIICLIISTSFWDVSSSVFIAAPMLL